jgi:hypothetical protein
MSMRRCTRLTNGFSKKVDNLAHAVSLHYMAYNFARPRHPHQSDGRLQDNTRNGYRAITNRIWTPRHRRTTRLMPRP